MTSLLVSARQLEVLQAAAEGRLFADGPGPLAVWRVDDGRACSLSAWCLLDRGLVEIAAEPDERGRLKAVVTEAGLAILAELASREPESERPEVTP